MNLVFTAHLPTPRNFSQSLEKRPLGGVRSENPGLEKKRLVLKTVTCLMSFKVYNGQKEVGVV